MALMSKSKLQIATEHLRKAQAEAVSGDLSDAIQWGFASLEAGGQRCAAGG